MPGPTEFSRAHLKSRNSCLFLQRAAFAALKSLGIHKRFLRFFALYLLALCEKSVDFFIFRYALMITQLISI